MFLKGIFQQERFDRFLWYLASLIKNGRTLRNCFFKFIFVKKRLRYQHMFKTTFLQKMLITAKL